MGQRLARIVVGLTALACAACIAGVSSQFDHVAPQASLTSAPHTADEIRRFSTYHGPSPSPQAEAAWRDFLDQRLNRAMAVSETGAFGTSYGWIEEADAVDLAMKNCKDRAARSGTPGTCRPYAINSQIVYPGQEYTFPFRGQRIGDFAPYPEYTYYGPARAKGLLVWSHGTYAAPGYACGAPGAKNAAWSVITKINQAGWDIVRFDRDPCQDDQAAATRKIAASVPIARALGYRKIVLAGQSRGAIASLQSLRDPAVVRDLSAVIAISPAESGKTAYATTEGPERWKSLVNGLSGNTTVAVFFFKFDEFIPEAAAEAEYARAAWRTTMPNAHVYYNDANAMIFASNGSPNGHGGAGRPAFTAKYSDCLITLIDTGNATGACAQ